MMLFGGLLFVGLFVALAYALGWIQPGSQMFRTQGAKSPLDILNERYARGEISKQEYDQMRLDIKR